MKNNNIARFQVRMPSSLHKVLVEDAKTNNRSLNAQVVYVLKVACDHTTASKTIS